MDHYILITTLTDALSTGILVNKLHSYWQNVVPVELFALLVHSGACHRSIHFSLSLSFHFLVAHPFSVRSGIDEVKEHREQKEVEQAARWKVVAVGMLHQPPP